LKSTDDLPVAPDKTTSKQKPDTVKPEPVKSSEVAESKPAAEGKKVEAGNSGGAVIEAKPERLKNRPQNLR